jgi:hypothetical protein
MAEQRRAEASARVSAELVSIFDTAAAYQRLERAYEGRAAFARSEAFMDQVQTALDLGGMIPVIGEPLDLFNGMISGMRGDTTGALLSMAAILPIGGQAAGATRLARRAAAEVVEAAPTATFRIDTYSNLSGNLPPGYQAHHLNQSAAYGSIIPHGQGASIPLQGNIFIDVGAPHTSAHVSLEGF